MRHQNTQVIEVIGKRPQRAFAQLKVRAMSIMQHQPARLAANLGVGNVVLHLRLAGAQTPKLAGGIIALQHPYFAAELAARFDVQELFHAIRTNPHPETLVRFIKHAHIVGDRGTHLVPPHGIGAPCVVDTLVKQVLLTAPGQPRRNTLNGILQQLARSQVLDAQRVALVTGGVGGISQEPAGLRHPRTTQREKLVSLCQHIAIKNDFLALRRGVFWNDRRGPRILVRQHRKPARKEITLPLLGTAVIPVITVAGRHGHVRFLHPRLDLLENILPQLLLILGHLIGVGVLGLKVGDGFSRLLVPQPLIVINKHPTMMRSRGRVFRCVRCLRLGGSAAGFSHGSPWYRTACTSPQAYAVALGCRP